MRKTRRAVDVSDLLQEVVDIVRQGFPSSIEIRQTSSAANSVTSSAASSATSSAASSAAGGAQKRASNPPPKLVNVDSTHLHQMFMNLCINARDAMPDGGVLTLSIETCFIDERLASKHLGGVGG